MDEVGLTSSGVLLEQSFKVPCSHEAPTIKQPRQLATNHHAEYSRRTQAAKYLIGTASISDYFMLEKLLVQECGTPNRSRR